MDNKEKENIPMENHYRDHRMGRIYGGLFLLIVGGFLFAYKMGAELPHWLFTWPMLMIVIGIFIGAKHSFKSWGWLFPVGLGALFLLDHIIPGISLKQFMWPIIIIAIGLFMIFKPKRYHKRCREHRYKHGRFRENIEKSYRESWEKDYRVSDQPVSNEDVIDVTAIFSGVSKNIISKNFKGGVISCVFGGAEIDLSKSDIQGTVVLDITNVFGGTKLVIPSNWKVNPDVTTIAGGLEDGRKNISDDNNDEKILVLKGTTVFGGIEINNY